MGVFLEQGKSVLCVSHKSPTQQPRGHSLVGGAEDEEGAGFWDGHCLLLQLQLSQGPWSGAHWDLGLVFFIVPYREGERDTGVCFHTRLLPWLLYSEPNHEPPAASNQGGARPVQGTRMAAEASPGISLSLQ